MTLQRPLDAPRRPASGLMTGPAVGCLFCREPIQIASFAAGPPDPQVLSSVCSNCGLRVSATTATLGVWSRTDAVTHRDDDLAARMRARRVASGARAIIERAGAGEPLDGFPV
jgi:hypothetical protein